MPNTANERISKSLTEEIGARRSYERCRFFFVHHQAGSSRAVRRGRQLSQRKFVRTEGQGRAKFDGDQSIDVNNALGAGPAGSCSSRHGRPRFGKIGRRRVLFWKYRLADAASPRRA